MNRQKLTLLMGLTTASVLVGGILAPAQAVLVHNYSVSGAFNDGSAIKGNFDYDGTNYSNATIKTFAQTSVVGTFTAKNYVTADITGFSGSTLTLASGVPLAPFSQLSLTFGSLATLPLTSSLNGANELQLVFTPAFSSNTRTVVSGTITQVPFDTPALPIMGSTLLFGFGVWAKNKKGQAKKVDLSA